MTAPPRPFLPGSWAACPLTCAGATTREQPTATPRALEVRTARSISTLRASQRPGRATTPVRGDRIITLSAAAREPGLRYAKEL